MITLKGLTRAPLQRIFDQAARHLLKQNKKSTDEACCCYRGLDNTQCAVGCFISDEEYKLSMEGLSSDALLDKVNLNISRNREKLLSDLQVLHDNELVEDWESSLKHLAIRYSLKFSKKNLTK